MSTDNKVPSENSQTRKLIEAMECIIYKNSDDIAVSIARSFERLEERIDTSESRIYSRLADIEDKMCGWFQDFENMMDIVKEEKQHDANTKS